MKTLSTALLFAGASALLLARTASATEAVATFHSIGLSWTPQGAGPAAIANVRYRPNGSSTWTAGLPLWFDSRNGEYRGSLVGLTAGTQYEIELSIDGTSTTETLTQGTWPDSPPIGKTITLPGGTSSQELVLDAATYSGTPDAWTLVTAPPEGATIDVADGADASAIVQASYVILRGVTLKGGSRNGVELEGAHDVVIERCDISGFGRVLADGWGTEGDAGVQCQKDLSVERVVIQRNHIHQPRVDSNSWEEPRPAFGGNPHPAGTSAVYFDTCGGNHVIRYNQFDSDQDHYFEDVIGGADNYTDEGFPRENSDIYGNVVQNCWDDGIESEGRNKNVRIWGNYIDHTMVKIACAATTTGPLYIFRNISDVSRRDDNIDPDQEDRGPFLKTGSDDQSGGGRMYVFHNTLLQPPNPANPTGLPFGAGGGLADPGGPMLEMVSRNNLLFIWKDWWGSVIDDSGSPTNDFDFDAFNGTIPGGTEPNGHKGVPVFDAKNGAFEYALDPSSVGFDQGTPLPGFNDDFAGKAPDVGAFEAGAPAMQFGVDAYPSSTGAGPGAGGGGAQSSGAGAGGPGAGSGGGGSSATAGDTPGAGDAGGCGCRVAGGAIDPRAALLFGLLGLAATGRRRTRATGRRGCR